MPAILRSSLSLLLFLLAAVSQAQTAALLQEAEELDKRGRQLALS